MAFEKLLGIYQAAGLTQRYYESTQPDRCPNDGTILEKGLNGELHCPFDGWLAEGRTIADLG